MKFTMTKIAAGLVLATAAMSAQAVAINNTSNFVMYDSTGGFVGGAAAPTLTGFIDTGAMTWGVASTTPFFGSTWTASGGQLYGAGTHTVSTADPAPGVSGGSYTFTVGAGQLGGMIDFAWGGTTGIDVLNVWNVTTVGSNIVYASTDVNGDGILGIGMIDGPFQGFNANFNISPGWLTPEDWTPPAIPEASTYAMMLAGLGLVGFMARRRRNAEA